MVQRGGLAVGLTTLGKAHKQQSKPGPTREELEAAADAERLKETRQVASQPHRVGYTGEMSGPFGDFVRSQDCGRRCWEGGQLYIQLVAKWRKVNCIPWKIRIEEEGTHGGGELDPDTVAKWGQKIRECENAMKCSGLPGFRAANDLVLEEIPVPVGLYGPVKRAITQLAICLGLFA